MFDDNDLRAELNQAGSVARAEQQAEHATRQAAIHRPWTAAFAFLLQHQRTALARQVPPRFVGGSPADETAAKERAVQFAISRLRLAKETVAAFGELANLSLERQRQFAESASRGGQELLDMVREIASEHPVLAKWSAEQKTWSDRIDATTAAAAASQHAAWLSEAPARAIAAAEAGGAVLSLDRTGHIVAPAAHAMTADTLQGLREHKEAVVAILAARAAAAARVVVV